ncbi:hypothetical protein AVEN_270187-1 [Araneus ventricosus]|uniref:Uncharacterized protein n=1 Tax=Araneus ventricosus TaxID=182803 RepID=A0A4Y2LXA2_ARAVE|nr:hypothetical protein AVEN_270187-1 [Araneus ventricosus]
MQRKSKHCSSIRAPPSSILTANKVPSPLPPHASNPAAVDLRLVSPNGWITRPNGFPTFRSTLLQFSLIFRVDDQFGSGAVKRAWTGTVANVLP